MKTRLTITLSKDILKKVDSIVDGSKIRNRSHAIEHLLAKGFGMDVDTAVILAGGKFEGNTHPLLLKINKKHLFENTAGLLKDNGIKTIIICAGKYEAQIKKVFKDGEKFGLRIYYVSEKQKLGTAGVLIKARELLAGRSFLVMHGDVLTKLNLSSFMKFHQDEASVATMAVKPRLAEKKYGKVILQGNKIVDFAGQKGDRGLSIVNAGIYLFEPEIFNYIPNRTPAYLDVDVFPKLAVQGRLSAYIFQGIWYDISRKNDYKEARKVRPR